MAHVRGRDEDFSSSPAKIPASGANAPGSSLGSNVGGAHGLKPHALRRTAANRIDVAARRESCASPDHQSICSVEQRTLRDSAGHGRLLWWSGLPIEASIKSPGLINECVLSKDDVWRFKSHTLRPVFMGTAPPRGGAPLHSITSSARPISASGKVRSNVLKQTQLLPAAFRPGEMIGGQFRAPLVET